MKKSTESKRMPPLITKKRAKVKKAGEGNNSTRNGKQSPWFTIGGFGDGTKKGEMSCGSPWNPGKCFPSKRYQE